MMTDIKTDILKNVSRETLENLKIYQNLLCEWQKKINLVSKNSLVNAWERHFLDSAQIASYVRKDAKSVYDFGSGAGFPALVLATIFKEINPETHFVLIESITKKTLFLNEVIKKLDLNADVMNDRIEKLKLNPADYITARAVTNLSDLLKYSVGFCRKNTICLFPKGKNYEQELIQAQNKWTFWCKTHQSKVADDGVILEIKNLRRKRL